MTKGFSFYGLLAFGTSSFVNCLFTPLVLVSHFVYIFLNAFDDIWKGSEGYGVQRNRLPTLTKVYPFKEISYIYMNWLFKKKKKACECPRTENCINEYKHILFHRSCHNETWILGNHLFRKDEMYYRDNIAEKYLWSSFLLCCSTRQGKIIYIHYLLTTTLIFFTDKKTKAWRDEISHPRSSSY